MRQNKTCQLHVTSQRALCQIRKEGVFVPSFIIQSVSSPAHLIQLSQESPLDVRFSSSTRNKYSDTVYLIDTLMDKPGCSNSKIPEFNCACTIDSPLEHLAWFNGSVSYSLLYMSC